MFLNIDSLALIQMCHHFAKEWMETSEHDSTEGLNNEMRNILLILDLTPHIGQFCFFLHVCHVDSECLLCVKLDFVS